MEAIRKGAEMMNIRNSAKGIIFRGEEVLLTKNLDDEGFFYLFPGGGQEFGETLHDAVKRECMEEVGQEVEVGELLFIARVYWEETMSMQ